MLPINVPISNWNILKNIWSFSAIFFVVWLEQNPKEGEAGSLDESLFAIKQTAVEYTGRHFRQKIRHWTVYPHYSFFVIVHTIFLMCRIKKAFLCCVLILMFPQRKYGTAGNSFFVKRLCKIYSSRHGSRWKDHCQWRRVIDNRLVLRTVVRRWGGRDNIVNEQGLLTIDNQDICYFLFTGSIQKSRPKSLLLHGQVNVYKNFWKLFFQPIYEQLMPCATDLRFSFAYNGNEEQKNGSKEAVIRLAKMPQERRWNGRRVAIERIYLPAVLMPLWYILCSGDGDIRKGAVS